MSELDGNKSMNFIEEIITKDNENGKWGGKVQTRFPPEPNGFLHIGHAKSICLNFGIAEKFNGKTNLRFDDTNPSKEEQKYVDGIREDIKWLGFDWEEREFFASDYFDKLYEYAIQLIKKGKAYVDDSTPEELKALRGDLITPGTNSPFRDRTVEENLDLFERMKAGQFEEGSRILRAKINMADPNIHMRDPALFRIKTAHHHRTGDKWCIYPMYDYAHCLSDSIEGITHSLCTLEFEVHRPLYDWVLDELDVTHPQQIEFARLNLNYTIMSKRKLLKLVTDGHVTDWDDPRMPTISGLRRRGYTPSAIRTFAEKVGIAKRENIIEISLLEHCIREDLNKNSSRVMTVLDPLKITITNFPEGETLELPIENNPEKPEEGSRLVPFSKSLLIEKADFMEDPPKKYFRLAIGRNVRLKGAFIITADEIVKNEKGEILEVKCRYFPDSKSGEDTSGIKAKGTLHWVSEPHGIPLEVRQYDRLFTVENPGNHPEKDYLEFINPDSLKVISTAIAEPSLENTPVGSHFQFMRMGYFVKDKDSKAGKPVFNRTIPLKDSWAKISNKK